MSALKVFPFRTANDALSFELGSLPSDVHSRTDDTLDAYSDVTEPFTLDFVVDPDAEALGACLPPGIESGALELCVATRSILSRSRSEVWKGQPIANSIAVQFDPADYMGRVDVILVARLKASLEPIEGHAHLKGSVVAFQTMATLWFDEPPAFSGDALDILWRDFDEDDQLTDGHLFAVGLEGRPVIYLNEAESMSPLRSVLMSKGTHGAMARTRDAVFAQIVHQAWTSILGHCFMQVQRHGDDDAQTVLDEVDQWIALVLREWAPAFVDGVADPDDAVLALIDRLREDGNDFLLVGAPAAIQRKCDTMKGFWGLANEFASRMS